jgi:NAD(P)-dependent dehydrogenase (short-subunit alcohol dehydrogenase family)
MVLSKGKSPLSVDGYELHFAVMHLGHFLLTTLFLPLLQKTKGSRVINIASEGHRLASKGTFNDFKCNSQGVTNN